MRWEHAFLKVPTEYATDELGNRNPIAWEEVPARARMTNWTNEEKTALDPEYTRQNRKLLLLQSRDETLQADAVIINGNEYFITERITTNRWQILHIRGYKQ